MSHRTKYVFVNDICKYLVTNIWTNKAAMSSTTRHILWKLGLKNELAGGKNLLKRIWKTCSSTCWWVWWTSNPTVNSSWETASDQWVGFMKNMAILNNAWHFWSFDQINRQPLQFQWKREEWIYEFNKRYRFIYYLSWQNIQFGLFSFVLHSFKKFLIPCFNFTSSKY